MPTWTKVTPGHVFHVGEKIRLGGREGTIAEPRINYGELFAIQWDSPYYDRQVVRQNSFPDLEIAVSEPTISPAAAEELKKKLGLTREEVLREPKDSLGGALILGIHKAIDSMVEAEEGE